MIYGLDRNRYTDVKRFIKALEIDCKYSLIDEKNNVNTNNVGQLVYSPEYSLRKGFSCVFRTMFV